MTGDLAAITSYLLRASKYCNSAVVLVEAEDYESSVSRSYYAMFFAAEAALLSKGLTQSTHKGVHRLFGEHFLITGIFPTSMGKDLSRAFGKRQLGDYDSELSITRDEAQQLCKTSAAFIQTIRDYLQEHGFFVPV